MTNNSNHKLENNTVSSFSAMIAQTGVASGPQSWKFCLFQQLSKVQYCEPGLTWSNSRRMDQMNKNWMYLLKNNSTS